MDIVKVRRDFEINLLDDVYNQISCIASVNLISPQDLVARVVIDKLVL